MLITVVMAAVPTRGPTDCLVSPPTLKSQHPYSPKTRIVPKPVSSQNVQSHQKNNSSHKVRGETSIMSFALGANREGKERVKGNTSRIQSSRIGFARSCVYAGRHSLVN